MYLTKVEEICKNDYGVHRHLKSMFEDSKKLLFFRNESIINVVSDIGICVSNDITDKVNAIKNGKKLIYNTRINPQRTKLINGKHCKIQIPVNELDRWVEENLPKKFEACGFISNHTVAREGRKICVRKNHTITYYPLLVSGYLTVTDEVKFKEALLNGIGGRFKFLGMGMINIYDFM